MPEISRFFGIVIRMYYREHNPPHFHATYGADEAQFDLDSLQLMEGQLNARAQRLVGSGRRPIATNFWKTGNVPAMPSSPSQFSLSNKCIIRTKR